MKVLVQIPLEVKMICCFMPRHFFIFQAQYDTYILSHHFLNSCLVPDQEQRHARRGLRWKVLARWRKIGQSSFPLSNLFCPFNYIFSTSSSELHIFSTYLLQFILFQFQLIRLLNVTLLARVNSLDLKNMKKATMLPALVLCMKIFSARF